MPKSDKARKKQTGEDAGSDDVVQERATWTEEEDGVLLDLLKESSEGANAADIAFSPQQWTSVIAKFCETYPKAKTRSQEQFKNHEKILKQKWKNIQAARKESGFGWKGEPVYKITVPDAVMKAMKEENPKKYKKYHPLLDPWPNYPKAHALYKGKVAEGLHATNGGEEMEPEREGGRLWDDLDSDAESNHDGGSRVEGDVPDDDDFNVKSDRSKLISNDRVSLGSSSKPNSAPPSRRGSEKRKGKRGGDEDKENILDKVAGMFGSFVEVMKAEQDLVKTEREEKRRKKMTPLERALDTAAGDEWSSNDLASLTELFSDNSIVAIAYATQPNKVARKKYAAKKAKELMKISLHVPEENSLPRAHSGGLGLAATSVLIGNESTGGAALADTAPQMVFEDPALLPYLQRLQAPGGMMADPGPMADSGPNIAFFQQYQHNPVALAQQYRPAYE